MCALDRARHAASPFAAYCRCLSLSPACWRVAHREGLLPCLSAAVSFRVAHGIISWCKHVDLIKRRVMVTPAVDVGLGPGRVYVL